MQALLDQVEPFVADDAELKIARVAADRLRAVAATNQDIQIVVQELAKTGEKVVVPLPARAVRLVFDLLQSMAEQRAFSIIPLEERLTTQQAADYLNVSRPYLCKLIDEGKLDATKVGRHRRIRFADLLAFEERSKVERRAAIEAMAAEARELELD